MAIELSRVEEYALIRLNRPQALNALMISRALERIADHATNIAEDVIFWVEGSDIRHHKSLSKAAELMEREQQIKERLAQNEPRKE